MKLLFVAVMSGLTVFGAAMSLSPSEPPQLVTDDYGWAPVPGATGYKTALYQGGHRVYVSTTVQPAVAITIAPGTYRWYVWPLGTGSRHAVVSSNLEVK